MFKKGDFWCMFGGVFYMMWVGVEGCCILDIFVLLCDDYCELGIGFGVD